MLRATLKSLLSRKVRLLLSGTAVLLAVTFMSGALVLNDTLHRSFANLYDGVYSGVDVQVAARSTIDAGKDADDLPAAVADRVRAVSGVRAATGVVSADGARLIGADGKVVKNGQAPRLGLNWTAQDHRVQLREGRGPTADGEIAVNALTARKAGLHVGQRVDVLTRQPRQTFTVVGIFGYTDNRDSLAREQAIAFTTPVAQRLILGREGVYSFIQVDTADPAGVRDRLRATLGGGFDVATGPELAEKATEAQSGVLDIITDVLLGFAAVAVFVGIFLILNTFSIVVAQRTRELALMRALGGSRRQVIASVLMEASIVGLVAAALGVGAGIGVGALASQALLGDDLAIAPLQIPYGSLVACLLVGLAATVVAALTPALRASRIAPIAAMREPAGAPRPMTRIGIAGGLLTAGGAALLIFAGGTALALLGGVLLVFIGVALLTPLFAGPVIGLLGRALSWSTPGDLGRRNSARNPRRTAITAAALMIGVALVTAGSTVASSIKASVGHAVHTNVKADLAVSGDETADTPTRISPEAMNSIRAVQDVDLVAGSANSPAVVDGKQTSVASWDDVGASNLLMARRPLRGSLEPLAGQVMVNETLAEQEKVDVGGHVTIQLPRGAPRDYQVAGVYRDTQIDDQFTMAWSDAQQGFLDPRADVAFIKVQPGAPVDAAEAQINHALADPELSAQTIDAFLDRFDAMFDLILQVVQILLGVAMIIAVLGIVNTLVLSVLERTRELGLLRAIGLRRSQTLRMITVESVLISIFGAAMGVTVGALLGVAVFRGLGVQGFNTLAMPWSQIIVYLCAAALVGVLAAIIPAVRAARLNVLVAIAHE